MDTDRLELWALRNLAEGAVRASARRAAKLRRRLKRHGAIPARRERRGESLPPEPAE